MLFNTMGYWLFFALVVAVYYALPARRRWLLLLLASYGFYAAWSPPFVLLLALSTVVDWQAALRLRSARTPFARRAWLGLSLATNLGLLGTFKYAEFFLEATSDVLAFVGVSWTSPRLGLVLPVGISFYTFQTLSYSVDVYRGHLEPEKRLGRLALYVSFFPQLVAGPIERATHLLPQLQSGGFRAEPAQIASGLRLALWGLFQKVVIADRLSLYVDTVYSHPEAHSGATLLVATYAFAFQIYTDFAGYSLIAIGCARALGFDLRPNFDRPYLARSIRAFWRRWHISLSTWLRDYLYVPLGGSRGGRWRTYRNLVITMLLGGLWHGAGWNFLIWGLLQGVLLVGSHALHRSRFRDPFSALPRTLHHALDVLLTFHLVCLGWVFFRAATFPDALAVLGGLGRAGALYTDPHTFAHAGVGLAVLALIELTPAEWRRRVAPDMRSAAAATLMLLVALLGVEVGAQFIYFQF